ncbi:MAG: exo-beta-1,3-glucanase, partial [Methylovulum sp.]
MKILSTATLIILLSGLFGWLSNLPQDAGEDVPEGKLNSLSFAPFREGQGPMDAIFPTPEQIDADLRLMGEKTHSIRTYASAEGTMPVIPALARKYGLTMIQGAWLGGVKTGNKLEVDELIRSANANPDVIKRVIVGNEVLLRGDLPPEELINYIREVKKAVKQPVSYADVWSMYMKYPELIKEVDFITIHILPYWEDEPIAVDDAPAHIERIYKHVQQEADSIAPHKPILIGESGWPSAGKQRGWAVPGVVNEAKFIRGLIKVANANGFDYNIVEAINQSWKSELEGVVGANWGLFSVDRKEVFPLTGKVYENPDWYKGLLVSIALFLAAVAIFRKPLQNLPAIPMAGFLVCLQVLAVLWVSQAEFLWYTSYSDWQRLFTAIITGLNAA